MEESVKSSNTEDVFANLFSSSSSGNGDEELLKIASDYSLQLDARQIRCLLHLRMIALRFKRYRRQWDFQVITDFIEGWLKYKKNNNSDMYVMRALDAISLRKFIHENSMRVDISR